VVVGCEFVPEVDESGFFGQLYDKQGRPYRWTNGDAKLVIPIDARNPPQALRLHLWPWRPPEVDLASLRIVVNQRELFHAKVSRDHWERTFDLGGIDLGEQVALQIVSDTFPPPHEVKEGRPPSRMLGVEVRGVALVARAETPLQQ
jgi:hypothetical protein